MMMRTLLLALMATSAVAHADTNLRSRAAEPVPASGYVAASAGVGTHVEAGSTLARVDLGRRLGESGGFIHGVLASSVDGSFQDVRAGLELRGDGKRFRMFGGLDFGAWLYGDTMTSAGFVITPRLGFEVGGRVAFRAAIELPLLEGFLPLAFVDDDGFWLAPGTISLGASIQL